MCALRDYRMSSVDDKSNSSVKFDTDKWTCGSKLDLEGGIESFDISEYQAAIHQLELEAGDDPSWADFRWLLDEGASVDPIDCLVEVLLLNSPNSAIPSSVKKDKMEEAMEANTLEFLINQTVSDALFDEDLPEDLVATCGESVSPQRSGNGFTDGPPEVELEPTFRADFDRLLSQTVCDALFPEEEEDEVVDGEDTARANWCSLDNVADMPGRCVLSDSELPPCLAALAVYEEEVSVEVTRKRTRGTCEDNFSAKRRRMSVVPGHCEAVVVTSGDPGVFFGN